MIAQGQDVVISPTAVFTRPHLCRVGDHVAIDHGFYCTTAITVGDYVHLGPYVTVIGGTHGCLMIRDFSGISTGAKIICAGERMLGGGLIGPVVPKDYKDDIAGGIILLEEFSLVGTNSVIMPGSVLAQGAVLGANSFLKGSTEPWTVYVGTPARAIKSRPSDVMKSHARELGYEY